MANYTEILAAWNSISVTDHTLLGENDKEEEIRAICQEATKGCPHAAAVCVYPKFLRFINETLKKEIIPFSPKIACVINFPHGTDSLQKVLEDTKKAVHDGADEIDLVINYKRILENTDEGLKEATDLTKAVKDLIKDKLLKVIIEVGELKTDDLILKTSLAVLEGNADFVKTSTGKVKVNATPDSVKVILKGIKQYVEKNPERKCKIGLKVAGGVGDLNSASYYILLAMCLSCIPCHPNNFRIGSSSLVPKLRKIIEQCPKF